MATNKEWICFDGVLSDTETAVAPVKSRGLMYGEGVFDTLRVYSGRTLFFSDHYKRTVKGLQSLGITIPDYLSKEYLKQAITKLLSKKDLLHSDAVVRLQFWREGERGYRTTEAGRLHFSVMASKCKEVYPHPHLVTVDCRRTPSQSMPSEFKYTNGINYILAAKEAKQQKGSDALMLTLDRDISETTIANIFWRKNKQVYTPSTECDLFPGITRSIVMEVIDNHSSLSLRRGSFGLNHIKQADTVWICNSVRELLAVKALDEKTYITDDTMFNEIKHAFETYRDQHLEPL
ncbi:aminotransferase class IV [Fodinibius saliphilus]|uniref:aminotransferase class IV n=1 Tax=Fodinibius saliphilus TaxID=1920650 RepID=UPI001107AD1C|nr:aminotransferase class IV [Fodinibius saliphilus]